MVESSLVACKSCGSLILKVNAEAQDGMCKVCCIEALRDHITELETKRSESLEQYMKEKERYLALVESMTKRVCFIEERMQRIAKIVDNLPMKSLTEKMQKIKGFLAEESSHEVKQLEEGNHEESDDAVGKEQTIVERVEKELGE